ncbi:hypothetical protein [uncultured Helicobacter sp.]|uniref:hypothetical protein n=1 Tax=uncultured Helicobacter sp. TaxID=175537 RepID=UPI002606EAEB|nr:hypothetical protein [uncultured Helicobacter sp.]
MKKTLAVFVVCSVLGANFCLGAGVSGVKGNTLPQNVSEVSKLSSADMEALFASNNVNAVILSQEEMEAAAGEFWPILIGLGFTFLSYLNAPAPGDPIYTGRPPF